MRIAYATLCLGLLFIGHSPAEAAEGKLRGLRKRVKQLENTVASQGTAQCYKAVQPNQSRTHRSLGNSLLTIEHACALASDRIAHVNYAVFQDLGLGSNPTPVAIVGDPLAAQIQQELFEDSNNDGSSDRVKVTLTASEAFTVQASIECCAN